MALKLQTNTGLARMSAPLLRETQPPTPMAKDLQSRLLFVVIALLSVAAVVFAWINFQKDREFSSPYDGVWWVESGGRLEAQRVDISGPGERAGIKKGDLLAAIDGRDVHDVAGVERQLYRVGVYSKATYSLVRQGIPLEIKDLILVPTDRSLYDGLRLIALVYLGIGLYVLLRRWTAPKSTHFYVFCLVSFVFYSFHYTGKLNEFDWIVYWANVVAWLLQPALFL
ncbi:MAG TPA: PDZ domain-containing protein, partial [Terriglobales bacterium]